MGDRFELAAKKHKPRSCTLCGELSRLELNPAFVDDVGEQIARPAIADLAETAAADISSEVPEDTGALAASVEAVVDGQGAEVEGAVTIGEELLGVSMRLGRTRS